MVSGEKSWKTPTVLSKEWMDYVDSEYSSPGLRAARVMGFLKRSGFGDYDLLCFAIEFTSSQAVVIDDSRFMNAQKLVNAWLYNLHYFHHAEFLTPDMKRVSVEERDGILTKPEGSSDTIPTPPPTRGGERE